LDNCMPESAGDGVRSVTIGGVGDGVDPAAFTAEGVAAETDAAVGESLAVVLPVRVATPTIVDGVSGQTLLLVLFFEREHLSS
jgi:hypothetical protein